MAGSFKQDKMNLDIFKSIFLVSSFFAASVILSFSPDAG